MSCPESTVGRDIIRLFLFFGIILGRGVRARKLGREGLRCLCCASRVFWFIFVQSMEVRSRLPVVVLTADIVGTFDA